jgi:O-antigen/teichoic acid export membrane protein
VILGLMLFHREVVGLVLGPDFAATAWLFPPMLVGIFVGLFGFLISNWQRARGDFRTHRRCYSVAAVVTVIAGLVLVPTLGAVGALWTFLCARCAELLLCVSEASYLPRAVLSRARIAAWAGLFLVLLAVAIRTSTANTAGAP